MSYNKTRNPRIAFVPSDEVLGILKELRQLSGHTMAWHVGDMLTDLVPIYRGQIDAMKKLANRPEEARQHIQDTANHSIIQIAQTMLDLPRPKRKGRALIGSRKQ
jgi:hypothetical protein